MEEKNNGLTIILVVVIVALLGFGAFYLITQNNAPKPNNNNTNQTTGGTTATVPEVEEDEEDVLLPLAEALEADGDANVLFTLIESADLEATLNDTAQKYTVFAPVDAAFASVTLPDSADMANLLRYHVISNEVLSTAIITMDGQEVTTLNGDKIKISVRDGEVYLNDTVKVIDTDVPASNGVIHLIDGVLMPQ